MVTYYMFQRSTQWQIFYNLKQYGWKINGRSNFFVATSLVNYKNSNEFLNPLTLNCNFSDQMIAI